MNGVWHADVGPEEVLRKSFTVYPASSYQYQVKACNSSGCSNWSAATATIAVPPIPGQPTGIKGSLSATTMTTSWNISAHATTYYVRQIENGNLQGEINKGGSRSHPYAVVPGRSYQYQVNACNGSGCSGWSLATSAIAVPPIPAIPTGLAGSLSATTINTGWNASAHATAYYVRQIENGNPQEQISKGNGRSHLYTVVPGRSYQYQVKACNGSGCSGWSVATATIAVPPIPAIPTGLAGSLSATTINTGWNASAHATAYYVRQIENGNPQDQISKGDGRSHSYTVVPGRSYQYQVKACNDSGCSDWSLATAAIAVPPIPASPVAGVAAEGTTMTVSWLPVSAAASYKLQQYVDGAWQAVINNGSSLSRLFGGSAGQSYSYRVSSCNSSGCSGWSAIVSKTLVPSVPAAPDISASSPDMLVQWYSVSGATRYHIQQYVAGDWQPEINAGNTLTKSFTGVIGDTYKFRLKACNTAGCSAFSAENSLVLRQGWVQTNTELPDELSFSSETYSPVSTGVGVLDAVAAVNGGQASYQLSVSLPPGRAGMQPQVGISYGSQQGNGLLGVGFALSAGGGIARCPATVAQDGFSANVSYALTTDRLCLNGQRLMLVSGNYGASNAVYRTELDQLLRVTQLGGNLNQTNTQFKVEYSNGQTAFFGSSGNAAKVVHAGRSEAFNWLLNYQQDATASNVIHYNYLAAGNGEVVLDSIRYTGNSASSQGDRQVQFSYEARPDVSRAYLAEGLFEQTKRLKTLTTLYGSTLLQRYELSYAPSSTSGRSLLRNITQCGYQDGVAAACLAPTVFDWLDAEQDVQLQAFNFGSGMAYPNVAELAEILPRGDVNGDGVRDWPGRYVNAEGGSTGTHNLALKPCYKNFYLLKTPICTDADFNLDGLTDDWRRSSGGQLQIKYTGGSWFSTGILLDNSTKSGLLDSHLAHVADYNGDGWPDLMVHHHNAGQPQLKLYLHSRNIITPYASGPLVFSYAVHESGARYSLKTDIQFMGDMTGNGRPDLIRVNTGAGMNIAYAQPVPVELLKNTTQLGSDVSFASQTLDFGFSMLNDTFSYFIDLNGDGLPDWVGWTEQADREGFGYRQNLGNGIFSGKTLIAGASLAFRNDYFPLPGDEPGLRYVPKYSAALKVHDINHDGIPELLVPGQRLLTGCAPTPGPGTPIKCGDALYSFFQASTNRGSRTSIDSVALDDSIYQFDAIYFDTAPDGTITARKEATSLVGHAYESVIIDAYGTGLPGLLFNHRLRPGFSFTGTAAGTVFSGFANQYGVYFNRNFGSGDGYTNKDYQPVDYLHAVTDGFSNRSEWRYRPLSTGENSTGQPFYETANYYQGGGYLHFASSMYAVQSFKQPDGIGGINETQFAYKGAMYHLQGRGFRGFRSIISHDMRNNLITYSDFRQKFPFSGQLRGQFVFKAADIAADSGFNIGYSGAEATGVYNAISAQVVDWQLNQQHASALGNTGCTATTDSFTDETDLSCPAGLIYNVYQAAADQYLYDLQSGQQYSHTRQQVSDIDANGNVLAGSTTVTDDSGVYLSSFLAEYAPQTNPWWPHRLKSRTEYSHPVQQLWPVLNYAANLDSAGWVKTSFSDWHASGTPQQVAVSSSDNSRSQSVTTSFNGYGLPLSVTRTAEVMNTAGLWSTQSRVEQIRYSKNGTTEAVDGYFPFKLTNALNHVSYIRSDVATGQPIQQVDANNIAVVSDYDAYGRMKTVQHDGQAAQNIWYDTAAYDNNAPDRAVWMQVIIQTGTPQQRIYFDALGRELRKSSVGFQGDWINLDTEYNERGLVIRQTSPWQAGSAAGETLYSGYDELGRPLGKSSPGGLQVSYQYSGLDTSIVADGTLTMSRSYNSLKHLMQTTDAKGGVTYYRYNGRGLPIVLQDANGVQLSAGYNALGQKLQVKDPNQGDSSYQYNGFGELEQETDANGLAVRFDYDLLGRQTTRTSYSGSTVKDSAAFSFDTALKGFPYQESSNGAVRTFGYDPMGNLTTNTVAIDSKNFTNQYFYDASSGLPNGMRYPNGLTVQYGYTPSGYLQEVSNAASGYVYRTINSQDAFGNMLDISLGNGVYYNNQYNSETGWVQSLTAWRGSTRLHDVEYQQYDVFGNIRQVHNHVTGATESYAYDELHRLTQSTYSNLGYTVPISYSYDAVGNLQSKSDYANTYRYGNAQRSLGGNAGSNAVRQVVKLNNSTVNFSYDNQGNLTAGDGLAISYNSFKQPTQISRSGNSFAFTYGANLERLKEVRNGVTTYEIDKLYEEESNGNWRIYLQDIAIIKYDSTNGHQLRYTHKDRLGSTLTYTDHNGQVTDRRMFDAFGKPRATDGNTLMPPRLQNLSLSRNGFTDHRHLDEVELIHMNGRAYDYNLGRFLSVDPIIQSPGNSQSLNPYSYIMNNPLAGTDPTGYMGCAASKIDTVCARTDANHGGFAEPGTIPSGISTGGADKGNGAIQAQQPPTPTTPTTDIQSPAKKSWNQSKAKEIADKYEDVSTDVDVEIAAMQTDPNDLGQTASKGGRRGNTTRDPFQSYINARYNRLFNQIRELDPNFSVARPARRDVSRREVEVLEQHLSGIRGAPALDLTPIGGGTGAAYRAARRSLNIPMNARPTSVQPNRDNNGVIQPGFVEIFRLPVGNGTYRDVFIRHDSSGHYYGSGNIHNWGPHFNTGVMRNGRQDNDGGHYGY
ncbi:RHS repeat-associated core domain-containing protein [Rheinheimera sp. EpRS3]|uniref:RHS repeat-associated core domain-containing protein n=1 Tax=Rheinheimera sp. EpRS3 TaxID=1712383 RepID=UPI0018D25FE6|nr:RHS repeat-associated core domain-containing protein [Rheinheimera sp. EpRS3]